MASYQAIRDMTWRWYLEKGCAIKDCPPEAKFLTGDPITDATWHYFQVDSGLDISLSKDFKEFTELKVVDE